MRRQRRRGGAIGAIVATALRVIPKVLGNIGKAFLPSTNNNGGRRRGCRGRGGRRRRGGMLMIQ